MKLRNSRLALSLLVTGALFAAGCGSNDSPTQVSNDTKAFKRPIKVGGVFDVAVLPVYVAAKRGFFDKHGVPLDGELVFTQGGSATVTGMLSGDFDFGNPSLGGAVRALEEGKSLAVVAPLFGEIWALSVREDLKDQIKDVKDLKGKTVGVTSVGSGTYNFLTGLLSSAGMDPKSDVKILPLGAPGNILAALKADRIDAAVTWEPLKTQSTIQGAAVHLVDLLDDADHLKVLGSKKSLGTVLAARSDIATKEPEVVKRVVAALREAHAWLQSHSVDEALAVLSEAAPSEKFDKAVMSEVVKTYTAKFPQNLELSREAYGASAKALVDGGVVKAYPALEKLAPCDVVTCTD
jgi:NitT/TauT family transport system substrate-binding protein